MNPTKPKLSAPAALLIGCVIGVLLMIFLPNPLDGGTGNTRQNLRSGAEQQAFSAVMAIQLAERASAEGKDSLSALLYAIAQSDSNQSVAMLNALPQPEKLADALAQSIGEMQNSADMVFPGYEDIAAQEGDVTSIQTFNRAASAKSNHAGLMQEALDQLERNLPSAYYLCPSCGIIYRDNPPDDCSTCRGPSSGYVLFK